MSPQALKVPAAAPSSYPLTARCKAARNRKKQILSLSFISSKYVTVLNLEALPTTFYQFSWQLTFFLRKRWISQDILPFIYSSIYPRMHPSIHPNTHLLKDPLRLSSTTISVSVSQSYLTLCDPMGSSPPSASARGTLQARILEWIAISFSKGFSRPRDQILISLSSSLVGRFSTVWATREADFY